MIPVPGFKVTTAYGKRGRYWSCNAVAGLGVHTGADFAAPSGTLVVAARGGVVRHTRYGSAFGSRQFAIVASDGSEDFYAHTLTRPAHGKRVRRGDPVARVGALGNATGPHLHFERHKKAGHWSCSNHTDPAPSFASGGRMSNYDYKYLGKPGGTLKVGRSYTRLDQSRWDPPRPGWESTLVYLNIEPTFKAGKSAGAIRIRLVRADGDKTAYNDFVIHRDALDGNARQLQTFTYWESGNGKVTRVELRCQGGLESAVIRTRYTKKAVVVK